METDILLIPGPLKPFFKIFRRYYYPYVYHGESLELFSEEFFPKFVTKQDVVLEIGSKRGAGTKLLSELAAYVYSFEPESLSFRTARRYLRHQRNVTIYNFAISDHNGESELVYDSGDAASASLKRIQGANYDKTERVSLRVLDEFEFIHKPTTMIIDCEGSEAEVLRGAKTMIPTLNTILIELHQLKGGPNTESQVMEELKQYSFASLESKEIDTPQKEQWVIALNK
ncbi:MAG TPA: FkbM family methyltransferase [Nitrososphaerales archaeon]|nr:FkbM family methyltransferase [Nitrososphaerales archaeon]